jgi:hypothetical protein
LSGVRELSGLPTGEIFVRSTGVVRHANGRNLCQEYQRELSGLPTGEIFVRSTSGSCQACQREKSLSGVPAGVVRHASGRNLCQEYQRELSGMPAGVVRHASGRNLACFENSRFLPLVEMTIKKNDKNDNQKK